ncbi:MAG: hydrogenobyrinic acid a,c-diamide synthase (glutamine-hydrolyzing) [Candidatus Methanoperedens sp.]|nr:hydrogenobyrinic acid a,c-diamide synthase (glutamine-hydrolyzing) [Candidatus Methanoperedens sp.]
MYISRTKALMIAGTGSGVGKTTIAMGLMAAISRKARVQPFKVGPDFIDPTHHTRICGRPSRNLDSYIMEEKGVVETFIRGAHGADFCIIEGVMGLFDGLDATEIASSAHIAKILKVPVILVINAQGVSRSTAALVKGFMEFDRDVNIQGIILNNIGSERHVKLIRDSLEGAGLNIPVIGAVPKNKNFSIPSRHLGLEMAHENKNNSENIIVELADFIEKYVDIDAVKSIAGNFNEPECNFETLHEKFVVKIGIANDSAFCFYYQDTFDSLKRSGAELVFFSPIKDKLPEIDGLYLGGGYPELFAKELEASNTRHEIKKAAQDGMPIYGECGALLYLGASLETERNYRMAGVLGASSRMTGKLQALGYTQAHTVMDSPFTKRGTIIQGHEFHYSTTECDRDARLVYTLHRGKGIFEGRDGLMEYNTLASYMHTHPASNSFDEFLKHCIKL